MRAVAAIIVAVTAIASAENGSLLVESVPAFASVYIDGRLAGETPLTLTTVAAGEHRVRMTRLGYLENSRVVTVKPGERATVRARLTNPSPQASNAAALKIVVVEGEGAVNIIQQKTAVAPVIEVRDRNDQPVSGAVVKFAIQKGKASFDGARTLTVTTNAAGRVTATGLTATGKGALQIGASAAFQGQTAAATIAQTTVTTAAEASSIASGGGVSTGGGLSHAAIAGIAGGAGAGVAGAVVLSKRNAVVISGTMAGPFNAQIVVTTVTTSATGSTTCASTRTINGMLTLQLEKRTDGSYAGTGSTTGPYFETAVTASPSCSPLPGTVQFNHSGPISGTASNITFSGRDSFTSTTPATVTNTTTLTFAGTVTEGAAAGQTAAANVQGTMTYSEQSTGTGPNGSIISGSGTTTFAVTVRPGS